MKNTLVILTVIFAFSQVIAAVRGNEGKQPVKEGVKKLAPIIGTWKIEGEREETPFSQLGRVRTTAICQWSSDSQFVVSNEVGEIPGGESHELAIYTFNRAEDDYSYYGIPGTGGKPYWGRLEIHDSLWTYPGQFKVDGKLILTRTTNLFISPDLILYKVQFSTDGKRWVTMGQGKETRLR